MKLKFKLPLILFLAFAVIIAFTFSFTLVNSARVTEAAAFASGQALAVAEAEVITSFFNMKTSELEAIEKSVLTIRQLDGNIKVDILKGLLHAYTNRPAVSNVYVFFKRGAYFETWRTDPGTYFAIDVFRPEDGSEIVASVVESETVEDDDDWFHVPYNTRKLHLTEPYEWTYEGEDRPRLMITLSTPIIINNEVIGVAGIDLELKLLREELFDKIGDANNNDGTYAVLVSHEGIIAVHPDDDQLLEEIGDGLPAHKRAALKSAITAGEYHRIQKEKTDLGEVLMSYVPIEPAGIDEPWSLGLITPMIAMQTDFIKTRNTLIITGVICVLLWGIFLLIFMSSIFSVVTRTVNALGEMVEGDGDLTIRLEERGHDEFGEMARGLNAFLDKLYDLIKTIQSNLSSTSSVMHNLSQELTDASELMLKRSADATDESAKASENVSNIAANTEELGASTTELSATAKQMGTSMTSVVQSVKDINASFHEMANDAQGSKTIAEDAITRVANARGAIDMLSAAADEVGNFVRTIKDVAKQTNLIAINATIEAARAGEVGKGFAVVASEVKTLADKSSQNANDITRLIENMQSGASNTINTISEAVIAMEKICKYSASISESIEEQLKVCDSLVEHTDQTNTDVTQVITTIDQMEESIQHVAQNAGESAGKVDKVTEANHNVIATAKETNEKALSLKDEAIKLKTMSEELNSIVSKFKT